MSRAKRMKKNSKKENFCNFIVYVILLAILIYSGFKIYEWYKDKNNNSEIAEKIKDSVIVKEENEVGSEEKTEENSQEYTVDFNKLKEQNDEAVAWLKVNNTDIEYPVVKSRSNSFYLDHNFDKVQNLAGWIFADYKNKFDGTDKNIVIYGHNMRDGSMFGTLKNILNSDWYNNDENTNIILDTENENCIYKVFAVYQIESEDYYIQTKFKNDNEFEKFINTLKARSIKEFDTEVSKDDTILTLSTCANNNKYRVVLHAKKM